MFNKYFPKEDYSNKLKRIKSRIPKIPNSLKKILKKTKQNKTKQKRLIRAGSNIIDLQV